MGSLALAGVQMVAESVEVMALPAGSFRETLLTEGAPWAIRRSCGSLRELPIFRFLSSDPVPTTSVRNSVLSPSPPCFFDLPPLFSTAKSQTGRGWWPSPKPGGVGEGGGWLRSQAPRVLDRWHAPRLRKVYHSHSVQGSVFQHFEGLGAAPLSTETGLWILQGPIRPSGLSSSTTVLLGRKARGRVCQPTAPPPSPWTSM